MAISTCTVSGALVLGNGQPLEGASVRYQIEGSPGKVLDGTDMVAVSWREGRATSNRLGVFSFVVPRGLRYRVMIDVVQFNKIVRIPATATAKLFSL